MDLDDPDARPRPSPDTVDVPPGWVPIHSSSPFAGLNGPVFEREIDGILHRGIRVYTRHTNKGGAVHGGMLMTLADLILGQAAWKLADGRCVTVRMVTDFLAPAPAGAWVSGHAVVLRRQDSLIHLSCTLSDERRPVLAATATFMRVRGGA